MNISNLINPEPCNEAAEKQNWRRLANFFSDHLSNFLQIQEDTVNNRYDYNLINLNNITTQNLTSEEITVQNITGGNYYGTNSYITNQYPTFMETTTLRVNYIFPPTDTSNKLYIYDVYELETVEYACIENLYDGDCTNGCPLGCTDPGYTPDTRPTPPSSPDCCGGLSTMTSPLDFELTNSCGTYTGSLSYQNPGTIHAGESIEGTVSDVDWPLVTGSDGSTECGTIADVDVALICNNDILELKIICNGEELTATISSQDCSPVDISGSVYITACGVGETVTFDITEP